MIKNNERITPHKFTEDQFKKCLNKIANHIPKQERFILKKEINNLELDIIYYLSKPKEETFPIIILCGGSQHKGQLYSIINVHRYFLQEAFDLRCALLTIENTGIDGSSINEKIFWENYTRSERLLDHEKVINNLIEKGLVQGWNGKIILIGISEGGILATRLTECFSDITLATINFVGASAFSWQDELWSFYQNIRQTGPLWFRLWDKYYPHCLPFGSDWPKTKSEFDNRVKDIIKNPSTDLWMGSFTYLYYSDASAFPKNNFSKLIKPYLVVSGDLDFNINSSDIFVDQAKESGIPITYFRVEGMKHYFLNRPDIIEKSFHWLKDKL